MAAAISRIPADASRMIVSNSSATGTTCEIMPETWPIITEPDSTSPSTSSIALAMAENYEKGHFRMDTRWIREV